MFAGFKFQGLCLGGPGGTVCYENLECHRPIQACESRRRRRRRRRTLKGSLSLQPSRYWP